MKFGYRKPNLKLKLKARTTSKYKRKLKKALIPGYGKKGMGWLKNPKKAAYNKVYRKVTRPVPLPGAGKGKRRKSRTKTRSAATATHRAPAARLNTQAVISPVPAPKSQARASVPARPPFFTRVRQQFKTHPWLWAVVAVLILLSGDGVLIGISFALGAALLLWRHRDKWLPRVRRRDPVNGNGTSPSPYEEDA